MISTRARFALHGLCFLARRPAGETTSFRQLFGYLSDWSSRLSLSKSYVGKVFQDLSRAGLVRAVPGRNGGYRLGRPAEEITAFDVVRAIDRFPTNDCCMLADGGCVVQDRCGVVSIVSEAQEAFYTVLAEQTIDKMSRRMAPLSAYAEAKRRGPRRVAGARAR